MAALGLDRCSVCDNRGCVYCLTPGEKPAELPGCWDFFTTEALVEILADASTELERRNVPVRVISL